MDRNYIKTDVELYRIDICDLMIACLNANKETGDKWDRLHEYLNDQLYALDYAIDIEDFYFEVRDKRGKLQAIFSRRWEAEKYAEPHEGFTVTMVKEFKKENTNMTYEEYVINEIKEELYAPTDNYEMIVDYIKAVISLYERVKNEKDVNNKVTNKIKEILSENGVKF